jgi:cation/acetate symporter
MAVMLAPFFRKFGAFTIPSYLGRRFESRTLRIAAGALLTVPMLLMLAGEIRMGAFAASWLLNESMAVNVTLLVTLMTLTLIAGGMRSLAWSTAAQSIASLIALLVPVTIVAILVTNLPLPQLSHGPIMRALGRAEAAQGLPIILPPALAFDMPPEGLSAIAKRYADAFGSVGPLAFVIVTITCLAGIASAPWLLPRVAATPGVYEARKSLGWATLLFGVIMLTLAAVAVFMRDFIVEIVTATGPVQIPAWFEELKALGMAGLETETRRPTISSFVFNRDGVLLSLPIAAELPAAVVYLAAGGVIAAALATAGAVAVALGNVLSEDIVHGLSWQPPSAGSRLIVSRIGLIAAATFGGVLAIAAPTDPLKLMLWSLALTASTAFPVLVLSIWWKRLNTFGAIAGIASGFGVTVLAIVAGEAGMIGLDGALAAALGLPAGLFAAIFVTLMTPAPGRHVLELVRDIRGPGGEILVDREMRFQRRQKR